MYQTFFEFRGSSSHSSCDSHFIAAKFTKLFLIFSVNNREYRVKSSKHNRLLCLLDFKDYEHLLILKN